MPSEPSNMSLESALKILTAVGAMVAFCWGAYQFLLTQRGQAEARKVEAARPFLDKQLALYNEAIRAAATIATSKSPQEIAMAKSKFRLLFWGELAMVEDQQVEAAMIAFMTALNQNKEAAELEQLSLNLAHACRSSLAKSWGVELWQGPRRSGTLTVSP